MILAAFDIATLIKIIIFLVVLASWVMRAISEAQSTSTARKKSRERKASGPVPPRPIDPMEEPTLRARTGRAPDNVAQIAESRRNDETKLGESKRGDRDASVRDEVDEFLRQAGRSEPRKKPTSSERSQRPQRIELIDLPKGPKPERARRLVESEPSRPKPPAQAKPSSARMLNEGSEVARHVAEHLVAGKLTDHAAQLGHDIEQTDERLQARLHATFDHRLGNLDDGNVPIAGTVSAREAPLAAELRALLSSPGGMRQAIILNEILARPVDKW